MLGLSSRPVLIADNDDQLSEARLRLARVGIEDARGFLEGGIAGWEQAGMPVATLQEASVDQVNAWLRSGEAQLLDVRREGEWKANHIEGAAWSPLDTLNKICQRWQKIAASPCIARVDTAVPSLAACYSAQDFKT